MIRGGTTLARSLSTTSARAGAEKFGNMPPKSKPLDPKKHCYPCKWNGFDLLSFQEFTDKSNMVWYNVVVLGELVLEHVYVVEKHDFYQVSKFDQSFLSQTLFLSIFCSTVTVQTYMSFAVRNFFIFTPKS